MNNSGYTTIEINGVKVGLKFGLPALKQIGEKQSRVPFYTITGDGVSTYSDLGIAHVIYAGYCNNQYIKDLAIDIPFEAFYNVVEDCVMDTGKVAEVLRPIIECFEQSKFVAPLAKVKDEDEIAKKKIGIGTKLKATVTES